MEKIRIFLSEILHGGIRVQFDARVGVSQVDRQKGLRASSKTSAFGLSVCQTPPVTPVLGGSPLNCYWPVIGCSVQSDGPNVGHHRHHR